MKVNVKQKDIDEGVQGCIQSCALALAVRRAFKNSDAAVYYDAHLNDEDVKELFIRVGKEYYNEPYIDKYEHLNNFIDWFDFGILGKDGCEPFKFNIDTSKTTI